MYIRFTFILILSFIVISCHSNVYDEPEKEVIKEIDTLKESVTEKITNPVLGWHRSKEGFKNYDYNVLNMLAYFSYKVDPKTGENEEELNWENDPIIDSALNNNCKVYLTITNFGFSKNTAFFNSSSAQDKLIENVFKMIDERNVTGVCVDFEEIHKSDAERYNLFIKDLSNKLKSIEKEVMIVLPIYYPENLLEPKRLDSFVDYYVMMGYACYHMGSGHAGPISPWSSGDLWEPYSLNKNVDDYLNNSFNKDKFMVALPLYGGIWETATDKVNSKSIKGIKEPTYNQIISQFKKQVLMVDSTSHSSYYTYKENGKNRQCWFESEENLKWKIEQLMNKDIAGFGFWALGYADKNPSLWNAIGETINNNK